MLSKRVTRLAPPPRPVPWPVTCSAMLGILGGIGALLFVFGLIFVLVFANDLRPLEEMRLANASAAARGKVIAVEETNSTENDVPVYAYRFEFKTRTEQTVTGRSYSTGQIYSVNDSATVYYLPDTPAVAWLEGTRRSEFEPFVGVIVLFVPAIGLALFVAAGVRGWRNVTLLRHGVITGARSLARKPTSMSVNDVPVLKFEYEFQTEDGQTYTGAARAVMTRPIGDEIDEPVLYLPSNPKRSMLLDSLSLRYPLEVDETGQWAADMSQWPVVLYGLALAGVVIGALLIYSRMLG